MLSLAAMAITIGVNVATLAFISGTTITRLNFAERELEKLSEELRDVRTMKEDIAVVKSILDNTQKTLNKIEVSLSKHQGSKDE